MPEQYYRVLDFPSTLERWTNGHFTSTHSLVPSGWIGTWKNLKTRNDLSKYPMRNLSSVFTRTGLDAFLNYATDENINSIWPSEVLDEVGELDGVCAFDNPHSALEWGRSSNAAKSDWDRYVVFEGTIMCKLPEKSGVLVKVNRVLTPTPLTQAEFVSQYT